MFYKTSGVESLLLHFLRSLAIYEVNSSSFIDHSMYGLYVLWYRVCYKWYCYYSMYGFPTVFLLGSLATVA